MITSKDILLINESKSLRETSKELKVPAETQDLKDLVSLYEYVLKSQNKALCEKFDLKPGVGLAAPQVGINKRMFAIYATDIDGAICSLAIMNPKIIEKSEDMIYLNDGEGCLSVVDKIAGVTPRYKKITIEGQMLDIKTGKIAKKTRTLTGFFSIVFQHEYDHLDGIIYTDSILSETEAKEKGIKPLWVEEN